MKKEKSLVLESVVSKITKMLTEDVNNIKSKSDVDTFIQKNGADIPTSVLSDINPELIKYYKQVQDAVSKMEKGKGASQFVDEFIKTGLINSSAVTSKMAEYAIKKEDLDKIKAASSKAYNEYVKERKSLGKEVTFNESKKEMVNENIIKLIRKVIKEETSKK